MSRLRFISRSSPPPSLFNWPRVHLYLKVLNHIYVLKWSIIHCLIYFGVIECLYMHLFCQVFGGNFRFTQSWVTNSSYAWLNFVKKILAMSFVFNFSREISISHIWQIFSIRRVKSTRKFLHTLKGFPNFPFVCLHCKITWYLGKVNMKVQRESQQFNWRSVFVCLGFTSFNVLPCWLPKTTDKLMLSNFYHFMHDL